jgi:hypothetical protein
MMTAPLGASRDGPVTGQDRHLEDGGGRCTLVRVPVSSPPPEDPDGVPLSRVVAFNKLKFDEVESRRWPIREARRILKEARRTDRQRESESAEGPPAKWRARRDDRKRR